MIRSHSRSGALLPNAAPDSRSGWNSIEIDAPFRDLFELAPVAYHEIDAAGIVQRVNQAECRILQFPREEMIGRPIWEFVSADQQAECRQSILRKVSYQELLEPHEHDFIRRDGGYAYS